MVENLTIKNDQYFLDWNIIIVYVISYDSSKHWIAGDCAQKIDLTLLQ